MNYDYYTNSIKELKETGSYRFLREPVDSKLIDLSSNDYLSLLDDTPFTTCFLQGLDLEKIKFSACSSRLLSGNSGEYSLLENTIAGAYKKEACLVYNSGYHANTGILPALCDKQDLILADKLVHASIIDGMRLSTATTIRYRHLDYEHLEHTLKNQRDKFDKVFIVSESIFSMDGDVADLQQLVDLKNKYNCYLYIDEAHAVGVRGENGLGIAEESSLIAEIDFIVGTFGKALASVGAYIVCPDSIKQFLVNNSRTLIYTTGLPPVNLQWTNYVFERLPELQAKRDILKQLSESFANLLHVKTQSHIIPYIVGENEPTIRLSQELKSAGFNVLPVRYPTVPANTARLRFSLYSDLDINQLRPIQEIISNYEKNLAK
jgi:8-amino-7-oxononanoate synthase